MTINSVYATLGLSRNPFPPTPDAGSYFFTPRLEEDFAEIVHCIEARKGFLLLTGEVGLGKSTMVRRLLDTLQDKHCCSALVLNTFLQDGALLSAIQTDFGLPPNDSVEQGLGRLTDFLIARHQAGEISLLVIDDAQNLNVQSLELVRLLCNLETGQEKLLQILLVGQPELEQTLARPELRQLKSRIIKHARLSGLQKNELARYFDFRVNAANGEGRLSIDQTAADLLHRATGGNLRQIHLVLDRCLYGLASSRQSVITVELVHRAVDDLPTLGEKIIPQRLSRRKAWLAAGLLAGTATTVAVAGFGLVSSPSIPSVPVENIGAESTSLAPIPAAVPAAVSAPALLVAVQAPLALSAAPSKVGTSAETLHRSDCEKQLIAAITEDDVLHVQRLPDGFAGNSVLKPSSRVCEFAEDSQPWVAWLGPNEAHHVLAGQQATRKVQLKLKKMGLLDVQELDDGLFGPKTGEAFARFQLQQGLAPTGKPDDLTFFLLEHQDAPAR